MNIARRPSLSLDVRRLHFRGLSVFHLIRLVRSARLFARVDVQKRARRRGAGKFLDYLARSRYPVAHAQLAADVGKCILKRVGVPKADAVTLFQSWFKFSIRRGIFFS